MPDLQLTFASGESSLTVRRFAVHEGLSVPFQVDVWARSPDAALDLEALVGKAAAFRVAAAYAHVASRPRIWSGVVSYLEQARSEPSAGGLSTYRITLVPRLWLLGHRTNCRVYQHLSIPTIVERLLGEWGIAPVWRIDRGRHPELEHKVQYEETDLAFVSRLLEEAGITLFFDDGDGAEARLVLADAPEQGPRRAGAPIVYVDNPTQAAEREFVTEVHLSREVRPGAASIRDVDFRRPAFDLRAGVKREGVEAALERYDYRPGGFLIEPGQGGETPVADDRGVARHELAFGRARVERALAAERAGSQATTLRTNVVDLSPGTVFTFAGHPHPRIDGRALLVTGLTIQGSHGEEWVTTAHAVPASERYVPPAATPRPSVVGVQTATVVGPAGDEIHTDEFGRVRVQFPWDREEKNDETSSPWIRVHQGWGGRGYGVITLPRIGQEVLVAFLEGDPDRPVIVGRVFNQTQPVPDRLPENKTQSDYRSNSSPRAEGWNQIRYEDKAGEELVYAQAQKNLRKLVKNDETITVGHDRTKGVGHDETDTTDVDRVEVTRHDRRESTGHDRRVAIHHDRRELVKNDARETTSRDRRLRVAKDQDLHGAGDRRERIRGDGHLRVQGDRRERIGGTQSLTVRLDQQERVQGSHALAAGAEIHLAAVETLIGEAQDVTVRGPGGFLRIDGAGVHIVGNVVDINVGGSAGEGRGTSPALPDEAKMAGLGEPDERVANEVVDEEPP